MNPLALLAIIANSEQSHGIPPCAVSGCARGGRRIKGFCKLHYDRVRRRGDPGLAEKETAHYEKKCLRQNCEEPRVRLSFCEPHAKEHLVNKQRKTGKTLVGRYTRGKSRAKKSGRLWNISFKEYCSILENPCYYCGNSALVGYGYSLDRKNNALGYTLDNVLPCCGRCNKCRQDMFTVEEWKIMMEALKAYNA